MSSTQKIFRLGVAAAVLVGVGAAALWLVRRPESTPFAARVEPAAEGQPAPLHLPETPQRWLVIGGGAEPASNQVSLEQDVALARSVLGGDGVVLFAGGEGSQGVQLEAGASAEPTLRARLGEIMSPRAGRHARYRPVDLAADGPTTEDATRAALERLLAQRTAPFLVFLTAHGEPGERPRDNLVRLWGGWPLGVADLTAIFDGVAAGPPIRLVVAACHGGGFAEMAFAAADPDAGPAPGERCGLFATTWDRVSSGCDPNPLRSAQEGYSLHFWHALRGEDRDGKKLPLASLDYDGDGVIGLLDAHTRARIASRSFDVPTTTSERWLRAALADVDARAPRGEGAHLPHEEAVARALATSLGLAPETAGLRLDELRAEAEDLGDALDDADLEVARGREVLTGALLARWPSLDDPWRDDFDATLARDGEAITRFLDDSRAARELAEAEDRYDELARADDALALESARVERLVRAVENLGLAAALRARGGEEWEIFERLRACESAAP